MFERYTEKARRVIFFARYEASQFGSPNIESEHMLLGLLREDKGLTNRFLRSHASVESIRKQIEAKTTIREKVSTSIDLPLSDESKHVLAYAAEEAERLGHKHIGNEHLLLGLLREKQCFAARILQERGLKINEVREELARMPEATAAPSVIESAPVREPFRDLTQEAIDGSLDPVVGRDVELECVIEILCSRGKKSPVLIGERGAGKTAVVEALAQRIADGTVPASLADKRILLVEPELIALWNDDRQKFDYLTKSISAKSNSPDVILFMDGLSGLLTSGTKSGVPDAFGFLRRALSKTAAQCIGADGPGEYRELTQAIPWVEEYFRPVHVRPLDEAGSLKVLLARKDRYEKFHGVTYTEEALEVAATSGSRYLQGEPLPAKALELIDSAGAMVKLRLDPLPSSEMAEVQKRIRFIVQRMENAIANHEFEKARFYSDEERKEREKLRVLSEAHRPADAPASVVGRSEIEEVISRWATYPYSA